MHKSIGHARRTGQVAAAGSCPARGWLRATPVHFSITVCDVALVPAGLHAGAQRILAGCAAAAVASLIAVVVAVAEAAALLDVGLAALLVARSRVACTCT